MFLIIHIDKRTVCSSPDLIEYSTHVLGFMTQGERPISNIYHVSIKRLSLCGTPCVFFVITFLQEDFVCVIKFLPESLGFRQKSTFM